MFKKEIKDRICQLFESNLERTGIHCYTKLLKFLLFLEDLNVQNITRSDQGERITYSMYLDNPKFRGIEVNFEIEIDLGDAENELDFY
jgi:outer membrane receptor protein involved in Fe transport